MTTAKITRFEYAPRDLDSHRAIGALAKFAGLAGPTYWASLVGALVLLAV